MKACRQPEKYFSLWIKSLTKIENEICLNMSVILSLFSQPLSHFLYNNSLWIAYFIFVVSLSLASLTCPNFGHLTLLRHLQNIIFLQVKNSFETIVKDCQFLIFFSFRMVLYYFCSMPTASKMRRPRMTKLGHTILTFQL